MGAMAARPVKSSALCLPAGDGQKEEPEGSVHQVCVWVHTGLPGWLMDIFHVICSGESESRSRMASPCVGKFAARLAEGLSLCLQGRRTRARSLRAMRRAGAARNARNDGASMRTWMRRTMNCWTRL